MKIYPDCNKKKRMLPMCSQHAAFFAMLWISVFQNNLHFSAGILHTRGFPGIAGRRIQFDVRCWTLLPISVCPSLSNKKKMTLIASKQITEGD